MKTFVKTLLALVVVFSTWSCTKEVSQENGGQVATGSNFYATINGESWKADSLEQVLVTDSLVTLSGLSKSLQEVSLVLPAFKVGKYAVNASTFGYGLYTTLSATTTDVYLTNSIQDAAKAGGNIEITAIDTLGKTVTGTFSFTGYRASDQGTVSVSSGVFDKIAYSRSGGGGGGTPVDTTIEDNGRDTLSAFVNDVFFKADPSTNVNGVAGEINGINSITVLGSNDAGGSISVTFPTNLSPGTHAMDYPGTVALYLPDFSTYYAPITNIGTIKILSNDASTKRVSGEFEFTGINVDNQSDSKIINKGYFAVTYQ